MQQAMTFNVSFGFRQIRALLVKTLLSNADRNRSANGGVHINTGYATTRTTHFAF